MQSMHRTQLEHLGIRRRQAQLKRRRAAGFLSRSGSGSLLCWPRRSESRWELFGCGCSGESHLFPPGSQLQPDSFPCLQRLRAPTREAELEVLEDPAEIPELQPKPFQHEPEPRQTASHPVPAPGTPCTRRGAGQVCERLLVPRLAACRLMSW